MNSQNVVELSGFGVAFGDRVVLADVSLTIPRRGLFTLVGPSGSGKSTLLRTIAGINDAHPALSTWGQATFQGRPLLVDRQQPLGEPRPGVGFVVQHAKFFLASIRENLVSALPNRAALDRASQTSWAKQLLRRSGLSELIPLLDDDVAGLPTAIQRRLALVRAIVPDPDILLADEPTAGLDDSDAIDVLALLRAQAVERAVLFVTHNQRFGRASGGTTIFLAGGRVLEVGPSADFFREPSTPQGREFLRTGNCAESSPNARPEHLDSSLPPPRELPAAATAARSRFEGPRGLFWVKPGALGGVPRPGIVDEVERDLEGLRRLGVSVLVTLEETETVPRTALDAFGLTSIHFPVVDMGVPTLADAAALAEDIDRRVRAGQIVAVHCRAGLGRTGTTLATQLIFDGESARDAIDRVRRINPNCIQSQVQVEFLSSFEVFIRKRALPSTDADTQEKTEQ